MIIDISYAQDLPKEEMRCPRYRHEFDPTPAQDYDYEEKDLTRPGK
jgi:hypothetical protein